MVPIRGVRLKRWSGTSKKRVTRIPLASPQTFGVHANSVYNIWLGVQRRVFFVERADGTLGPPTPPIAGAFSRLGLFKSRLLLRPIVVRRATREQFLERCPSHKRKVYEAACASLAVKAIERRDSYIRGFGKSEKVRIRADKAPVQRIIHPRDPRYNVELGRYIQTCERVVFKLIDRLFASNPLVKARFGHLPTVFKGMNAVESGEAMAAKWGRFKNPVCVGLDASRFDQHVSVEALVWEHSVYARLFPVGERAELARLLSWQLRNRVKLIAADGSVSYTVDGCRMSGDMNTSLGNSLIMCAMVWEYCRFAGVSDYELANNGDDCVVFMETSDLGRFSRGLESWFADMGFSMKVEAPVFALERVEFCQTRPICVSTEWRMVRTLARCIGKDSITLLPVRSERELRTWFASIGLGGLATASGVPVLQAFYESFVRASRGATVRHTAHLRDSALAAMGRGLESKSVAISDDTRVSFWKAFGIVPECQTALENYFASRHLSASAPPELDEFVATEFFTKYLLK